MFGINSRRYGNPNSTRTGRILNYRSYPEFASASSIRMGDNDSSILRSRRFRLVPNADLNPGQRSEQQQQPLNESARNNSLVSDPEEVEENPAQYFSQRFNFLKNMVRVPQIPTVQPAQQSANIPSASVHRSRNSYVSQDQRTNQIIQHSQNLENRSGNVLPPVQEEQPDKRNYYVNLDQRTNQNLQQNQNIDNRPGNVLPSVQEGQNESADLTRSYNQFVSKFPNEKLHSTEVDKPQESIGNQAEPSAYPQSQTNNYQGTRSEQINDRSVNFSAPRRRNSSTIRRIILRRPKNRQENCDILDFPLYRLRLLLEIRKNQSNLIKDILLKYET